MPANTDECFTTIIYTRLLAVISRKKFGLLLGDYSTFSREFAAIRNKVQLTAIEGHILEEIRR